MQGIQITILAAKDLHPFPYDLKFTDNGLFEAMKIHLLISLEYQLKTELAELGIYDCEISVSHSEDTKTAVISNTDDPVISMLMQNLISNYMQKAGQCTILVGKFLTTYEHKIGAIITTANSDRALTA